MIIRADHQAVQNVTERYNAYLEHEAELLKGASLEARTKDGNGFSFKSNIQTLGELPFAEAEGSDGIGLFRTEFFFMERSALPSEEEQFRIYKEVLERVAPRSVTIRTLDLGGDKVVSGLNLVEENPVLGFRAVRFCLEHQDIFLTQMRAILRASRSEKRTSCFRWSAGLES